jgi:hypothetical protein
MPTTSERPELCYGLSSITGHLPGSRTEDCPECPVPVGHREDVEDVVHAIRQFVADHPTLPPVGSVMLIFRARSRAELDGVAGDFGRSAPSPADEYAGAQFGVSVKLPLGTFAQFITSWHDR